MIAAVGLSAYIHIINYNRFGEDKTSMPRKIMVRASQRRNGFVNMNLTTLHINAMKTNLGIFCAKKVMVLAYYARVG